MKGTDLGRALRELRLAGGKEAKAVARSAAMSPSKLSKIENGRLTPSVIDVERILTALSVPESVKSRLTEAARAVATEATAWRIYRRAGLHKHQEEIRAIEAQTQELRVFQHSCVPGLLQSPEYVRAVQRHSELTDDALEKMISARIRRQEVLFDQSRRFRFLITEPVLRWELVPPLMMAAQLDRIVAISRLPNVTLGVVPLPAPKTHLPTCSFVMFDTRLVIVEIPHAEVTTSEPKDIEQYTAKFQGFERTAVTGEKMRSLIENIRNEFLREQEIAP
ncbi:helix-turn-helix domain-containing protein [Kitasatospora sp. NPDC048298]|uniref:helix-turn-helix domain-containing protein n=1 Tax=Kitasatospora sp. NPDC048298 TaxID=3364049 RepID=UPI003711B759